MRSVRSQTFAATILVLSGLCVTAQAQTRTIAEADRARAVDSLAVALEDYYVFPEKGREMADRIRERLRQDAYDQADLLGFTNALTEDIRAVSHDLHLSVGPMPPEEIAALAQGTDPEQMRREFQETLRADNYGFRRVERLDGNVGYLRFDQFASAEIGGPTAVSALNFLSGCDALIIDLRHNGGGDPSMIQLITSYFMEQPTHLNSFYVRQGDRTDQFWTSAWVSGPRMTNVDLYVLTSGNTFSAAEEFSYNLRNLERATLVGEKTGGGAHPVDRHIFPDLGIAAHIPFGRAINPITGTNWEGTGVEPHIDVPAPEAFDVAYREALETLLENDSDGPHAAEWRWVLEGFAPSESPMLESALLETYAGHYGDRILRVEDGALLYERTGRPPMRMIPMRDHLFRFDETPWFRLEIVVDAAGAPVKLRGHYRDGRIDESARS